MTPPPDRVEIPRPVLRGVIAHARMTLPDECCGLLVGLADGQVCRVRQGVPARNLSASPTRYVVDPADHFAAIRRARADGLQVVGAYHSHPGKPAVPSRRDRAESSFPDFVYLILSVRRDRAECDVGAYRLGRRQATPLHLVVLPGLDAAGQADLRDGEGDDVVTLL